MRERRVAHPDPADGTAVSGERSLHDVDRELRGSRPLPHRIALLPVFAYRRWLSPLLGARCRYEPSCSVYAVHAIDRFGILRGLVLASWRVARCNPLGGSGRDPVEDQRLFPISARLKRVHHP